MTTDTMREKFEAWAIQTFGESVNLTPLVTNCGVMTSGWEYNHPVMEKMRRAYEAAYARGQRDLIEEMGKPVTWRAVHKRTGQVQYDCLPIMDTPFNRKSWNSIPLYRLPEGAGK